MQDVTGGEGRWGGGEERLVSIWGGDVGVACVQTPLPSGKMRVVVNVMILRLPAMFWLQTLQPIKIPHLHDAVIYE